MVQIIVGKIPASEFAVSVKDYYLTMTKEMMVKISNFSAS